MKLEAMDRKNPELVCVATITEIEGKRLLIHFDGWPQYYDYWCEPDTIDIHPIGWCEKYDYLLESPNGKELQYVFPLHVRKGTCTVVLLPY